MSTASHDYTDAAVVDIDKLLGDYQLNREYMTEKVELFLSDAFTAMDQLRDGYTHGDEAKTGCCLHKMHSLSAPVHATRLVELESEYRKSMHDGVPSEQMKDIIDRLQTAVQATFDVLKKLKESRYGME